MPLFNDSTAFAESEPKLIAETRQLKGLSVPMMLICTGQELRGAVDDPICNEWIDKAIFEIEHHFCNEQYQCVLENVGLNGEFINHFDGRLVNPGHGIESAWFILHEAMLRGNDKHLIELGLKIVDWCWNIGWDAEYGGMLYFRDAMGLPVTEYWHDMKFWWPHNETIIATLLAYHLTGDKKYLAKFDKFGQWLFDSQVGQGEVRGWAHQYDMEGKPTQARQFEPAVSLLTHRVRPELQSNATRRRHRASNGVR